MFDDLAEELATVSMTFILSEERKRMLTVRISPYNAIRFGRLCDKC